MILKSAYALVIAIRYFSSNGICEGMKESELQRTVRDYLQIGMNQGKWYFDRLNSGSVLVKAGAKVYKVQLCREGTADFMVVCWGDNRCPKCGCGFTQNTQVIYLELKGTKGKQRPEQKEFQELVEGQGAEYFIIRSLEDLQEILK